MLSAKKAFPARMAAVPARNAARRLSARTRPFAFFADTPMAHQPCRAVLCGVFGDFWGSHGPESSRNRALGVIGWCRRPSLLLLSDVTRARAIDHGRAHGL